MSDEAFIASTMAGLRQYVIALLKEYSKKDASSARHLAVAGLSEAWLEVIKNEDGHYDRFAAKPLLRASCLILKDYLDTIPKDIPEEMKLQDAVKRQAEDTKAGIKAIERIVNTKERSPK